LVEELALDGTLVTGIDQWHRDLLATLAPHFYWLLKFQQIFPNMDFTIPAHLHYEAVAIRMEAQRMEKAKRAAKAYWEGFLTNLEYGEVRGEMEIDDNVVDILREACRVAMTDAAHGYVLYVLECVKDTSDPHANPEGKWLLRWRPRQ
jgi:hypothetical protein